MRQKKAKNKKENARAHKAQNGQTGNGCESPHKSGRTRRPGNDAAECGQRKAAEGRHDCGKPHAQPPGGGTSLHPGAASQTGQQKPRTHKRTEGKRQAAAAQTRPGAEAAGRDQGSGTLAEKTPGHRAQKPPGKTAAGRARSDRPRADGAARRAQKNPSEQAKFAFALSPARRGLVNRSRQKIASLFLAGTVFFCFAMRAAQNKGGAAPFYPPQPFEKGWRKLSRGTDPGRPCNFPASQVS